MAERSLRFSLNSPIVAWSVIFALALGVRLLYMYQTSSSPLFNTFQTDTEWHAQWVQNIVSGQFTEQKPFFRAPLYPYFLAGAYKITGDSFAGARLIQHLLGSISCVLVFLLARRVYDSKVALIAGLICAFYGPLVYFENELLIPSLVVFLLLLALCALCSAAAKPTWVRWGVSGLAMGFCAIARPNFLALVPVIVVWWFWRGKRERTSKQFIADAVMFCAGMMLPILPVTLHNRICGHEWVLVSTQGSVNFYIGNNPQNDGKTAVAYGPIAIVDSQRYVDNVWSNSRLVAEQELGGELTESEISKFWFGKSFRFWNESPGQAFVLTLRKAYYYFNGYEIESNRSVYLDSFWSPLSGLLIWTYGLAFPLGVIMPLALVGLFLPAKDRSLAALLRWFLIVYSLTVIAFFVTGRFRMPIVPLLIIFAATTCCEIYRIISEKQISRLKVLVPVLLLLLAICNSTFLQVRKVEYSRQAGIIGKAYYQLSQPGLAIDYFLEAIESNPGNFDARLNLGRAFLWLGRYPEAESTFREVVEMAPGVGVAHTDLGLSLHGQGKSEQAKASFIQGIQLEPDQPDAHYHLAMLMMDEGGYEIAWHHLHRAMNLGWAPDPEFVSKLRGKMPEPEP